MTLEDFFTLTEFKDGLTTSSRVEELVTCMQKNENLVVKNIPDVSRQRTTVAHTIAATKNRDCLDCFVQLGGFQCFSTWLKDALRFSSESNDNNTEETIIAILRALEIISLDLQCSDSSELWQTVKDLIGHGNVRIQDMARTLAKLWKSDASSSEILSNVGSHDSRPNHEITISNGKSNRLENFVAESNDSIKEEQPPVEASDAGKLLLANCVEAEPGKEASSLIQTQESELKSQLILSPTVKEDNVHDVNPSSNPADISQEKCPMEEQRIVASGRSSLGESYTSSTEDGNLGKLDASNIEELPKNEDWAKEPGSSSHKLDFPEDNDYRSMRCRPATSPADLTSSEQFKKEPTLHSSDNITEVKSMIAGSPGQDDIHGKDVLKTIPTRSGDFEAGNEDKEDTISDESSGLRKVHGTPDWFLAKTDHHTTEMKLEYGILDALEVATKVAQEVAREVDQRERSSSSSERISGGNERPGTPDSIKGKEEACTENGAKKMVLSAKVNDPAELHNEEMANEATSSCHHQKPENVINDTESSQVTEAAVEHSGDKMKALCDFDLNEEICSMGMDNEANSTSAAVPEPSVSQPVASPCLPIAPVQLEVSQEWKPFINAQYPQSACNITHSNKANDGLKEKGLIDIDLNVAEVVEDKHNDLNSRKLVPVSSGLQSGESSLEIKSPRKSERLKWALNTRPSELRVAGQLSHGSPSPSSSSSSVPPTRRNIDLNCGPDINCDSSLQGHNLPRPWISVPPYESYRSGASAISLMGTKVEVGKRELPTQASLLANGMAQKPRTDWHTVRVDSGLGLAPSLPCTNSPIYGYNGPTTPAPSFPTALYGPVGRVPYMVDSRGSPVVPHIIGSAPSISPMYQQPPFFITGAPPIMNVPAQRIPGLELDSRLVFEGGNAELMSLKPICMPGQGRLVGEHVKANSQPSSSSGYSEKRKEPDGGFELSPFNHRRQPPWR